MVSKASEDLPEPDTPVTTVSFSMGIENETFFRLLTRAPRTLIASSLMCKNRTPGRTANFRASRRTAHDNLFFVADEMERQYCLKNGGGMVQTVRMKKFLLVVVLLALSVAALPVQ